MTPKATEPRATTDPSRDPDRPLRVAFQGEPGAYSEEAVRAAFGSDVEPVPRRSFEDVARAVLEGETDRGLLPVENTLAGTVVGGYDVLAGGELEVVGEVVRPIRHCLLGVPGTDVSRLQRVLSHPVALAQCTRFFRAHPEVEAVAVYDTAGAARTVAERGDPSVAAIAARGAAERYGLDVLQEDLQDRADNQTRFYVVRRPEEGLPEEGGRGGGATEEGGGPDGRALPGEPSPDSEDRWKTAILFRTRNEPGALVDVLQSFSTRGVNLSKLESRPGEDPWTYRFFLELEDRGDRGAARDAVAEARAAAQELQVLGVFRRLA
ncbi:MAG: prephenate dehydratase domain-containing protein [Longimicrobiales bacterium]|nr:prephenate dehydratase domain-containing protein [Longimicrobiales bacterium]